MNIEKGIYWDKAWGLVQGCSPKSAGCLHCWSAAEAHMRENNPNPKIRDQFRGLTKMVGGVPTFNGVVRIREDRLDIPLRTQKPTVFAVWSDLFHEKVPFKFNIRAYWNMLAVHRHTFLILTKRPERMNKFISGGSDWSHAERFSHIWHGATAESQERADKRIPELLKVPGKRFLSLEPLLGPIELKTALGRPMFYCHICGKEKMRSYCTKCGTEDNTVTNRMGGVDAVIVGAESGSSRRYCQPEWIQSIVDQCTAAGVRVFVKQIHDEKGRVVKDINRFPEGMRIRELPWLT